jgi:hypothetical protein
MGFKGLIKVTLLAGGTTATMKTLQTAYGPAEI